MASNIDPDQIIYNGKQYTLIRLQRMTNSVDPDQSVPENDSVDLDLDQTAENGK